VRLGFGLLVRGFGFGAFGGALFGIVFSFAHAVAVSLDADDVRVVHNAVDECCGAGGIWEDSVPLGEEQVGRQNQALLLITSTDDLE